MGMEQARAQQAPSPPNINQILQQQRQVIQQQEQARRDEFEKKRETQAPAQQAAPEAQTPAQASHCVKVHNFVFEGAGHLEDSVKNDLHKAFAGKCMTIVDILSVVRAVTNVYVTQGYPTTRVFTPEQDLSKGSLHLKVVEGRTQSITLSENSKPRSGIDTAFPSLVGERLYIRDIEQGLDQINRLPGFEAKIAVKPGNSEGESEVVVDAKHPFLPLITTTLDNLGLKTTGEWQLGTTIAAGDLLGLYDSWALSYKSSSPIYGPDIGSDQYTASVSVPYGYWTATFSGSYFDYKSMLHTPNYGNVSSTGNSIYVTGDIERVIHRDQDSKTKFDAFINWKDTKNYFADELLVSQSHQLNVLGIRLSHTQRIFGGLFDGDINGQFGVPMFGSMTDGALNAVPGYKAEFTKLAGDASFYRPLDLSGLNGALKDVKLAYSFKASGQYSPDQLYSTEQLTLGGFYTVRGFKTQSLSGNSGAFVRNELIYTMPYWLPDEFKSAFGQVDLFGGLDAGGFLPNNREAFQSGAMSGAAAGMRLSRGPLFGEVSYEHPLSAPQFIPMQDQLCVQAGLLYKW